MIEQMKIVYNVSDEELDKIIDYKVSRLEERLGKSDNGMLIPCTK
jgi:hypothetical protein